MHYWFLYDSVQGPCCRVVNNTETGGKDLAEERIGGGALEKQG